MPTIRIEDGHVYLGGCGRGVVCTPNMLATFLETGRRELDAWHATQNEPTEIRGDL